MDINYLTIVVAALVPLITGFIWYNPKVFGNAWMQAAEMTEEKIKGSNMAMIFGVTFIMSLLFAMGTNFVVIHQNHFYSILMNEPGFGESGSELQNMIDGFIAQYGNNFRTFKHGALHGFIASVMLLLPVIAINAMFERKSWKYVWIHAGYWSLTFILIGGIICQWA